MTRASDRYPRRLGRVLPAPCPGPILAAGRRLRAPPRPRPDLRRPGPLGCIVGGRVPSINHVTRPLAPPSPFTLPAAFARVAARGRIARYARFCCPAVRGNDEDPGRQGAATNLPRERRTRTNKVRLDARQAPARAELQLAAYFGHEVRGCPIHGRLESEDNGAGPRLKIGAVRTRRLAASEAAARPSGSAHCNPLRDTRERERPHRPRRSVLGREDRRPPTPTAGAGRGRHLQPVDRARPCQRGVGARRAAGGPGEEPGGGAAPRCRHGSPATRAAERPGEAPVAGGTAAVAARPRPETRPRMTSSTGTEEQHGVSTLSDAELLTIPSAAHPQREENHVRTNRAAGRRSRSSCGCRGSALAAALARPDVPAPVRQLTSARADCGTSPAYRPSAASPSPS